MQTFSQLLKRYAERSGISDAEMARAVGVRRQTIFRWKEGTVARPRSRDDVLAVSQKLRLSPAETDELLLAAGFYPEGEGALGEQPLAAEPALIGEESLLAAPVRARLPDALPRTDDGPKSTSAARGGLSRFRWLGLGVSTLLLLALLVGIWLARRPPLPVAAPGETLVIVGQFVNFSAGEIGFNVAGRIAEPLRQEIESAGLSTVRVAFWPDPIRSEAEAQATLARTAAWMVIWGEYDSGRVLTRFTTQAGNHAPPAVESLVASPDELFATINSALPQDVRYLALLTLGAFYADNRAYAQARAVLSGAYTNPPQEPDARATLLFRLGLAFQLGTDPQWEEAIRYYTELLDLVSDHLLARYNRGLAYLDRQRPGDWEKALADFDGVIQRSPSFLAARIGRGVVYLYRRHEGDDTSARQDFSYVIEKDTQRTMAYYNRGLLAIRTDQRELWESDLLRVVELAPDFAGGYSALCWGYVLDEEAQMALPVCDQAVALGAPEALHSRGIAYIQAGAFAQAEEDLRAFVGWLETQPPTSPYQRYGEEVAAWLTALAKGDNPLTAERIRSLRQE